MPDRIAALASVHIDERQIVILPRGLFVIWGLRRRLVIPLERIAECSVTSRPDRERPIRSRLRGTAGAAIRAGYMRTETGRSWWLYRYGEEALVVDLVGDPLEFVVVAAGHNRALADAIERAQDPDRSGP